MKQVYKSGEVEPYSTPRPAEWPLRARQPYRKSTRPPNVDGWKAHQRKTYIKAAAVAVIWLALIGLWFLVYSL